MDTLSTRLAAAMARHPHIKQADIARACKVSSASVANWVGGKTAKMKAGPLLAAATLLGCSPRWLNEGVGLPGWVTPLFAGSGDAAALDESTVPPLQTWEGLMDLKKLPDVFRLELRDDALAPEMRAGDVVHLDRTMTPQPGDLVLVTDAEGRPYVREYRERTPGVWTAAAINPAYDVLDAQADQLTVAAVCFMRTIAARRSARIA